jgi:type I restriction enzyme S subunit
VIGPTQITTDNRLDFSKPTHLSRDKYEESPEIKVERWDILVVKVGNTIGKVAIVTDEVGEACINPNTVLLKRIRVAPRFLYYHLINDYAQNFLRSNSSASAQPAINQAVLKTIRVPVPPRKEQDEIVRLLGALDDKIELNRRMNETLEAIARAIFKSWFVDFDPVRAKMEGREPVGIDEETAGLFPSSLDGLGNGSLPCGWRHGIISDLGSVICGKTPPTEDPENFGGDVPFVTIPDMHNKVFVTATARSLSSKGVATQSTKSIPAGSIMVSCIATPGLVAITATDSQTNQQINSLVPRRADRTFFCYFALRELADEIRAKGSGGSVVLNMNRAQFCALALTSSFHEKLHNN